MSTAAVEKKPKTTAVQTDSSAPKKYWSEDEVCDREIYAYQKGKDHMKQQTIKQNSAGLKKAQNIAEIIVKAMFKDLKIDCFSINLKQSDSKNFSAIFTIPNKIFLSTDKYASLYTLATNIIDSEIKDAFNFDFIFMPFSKKINKAAIVSDGYTWTCTPAQTKK